MSTIEKAIEIATHAHAGQVDKAGEPYVFHPIRLMLAVSGQYERMVAMLHDVVEDTKVTLDDLRREGFPPEVIEAVDILTKKKKESRLDAAVRASRNPMARVVKLADVADNMDLNRITNPTEEDYARLKEYEQVQALLDDYPGESEIKSGYRVFTGDNFHLYEEDEVDDRSLYATQEEALIVAKMIVDKSLRWERKQSRNTADPDELYDRYTDFGDSPVIRPDMSPSFSAWDYAKARCADICREPFQPD